MSWSMAAIAAFLSKGSVLQTQEHVTGFCTKSVPATDVWATQLDSGSELEVNWRTQHELKTKKLQAYVPLRVCGYAGEEFLVKVGELSCRQVSRLILHVFPQPLLTLWYLIKAEGVQVSLQVVNPHNSICGAEDHLNDVGCLRERMTYVTFWGIT